jgi:HAE1 family hydrophobic/amphiphilic exporter-1
MTEAPRIAGISTPFILHPVATTLLMVGILFLGCITYALLPVASLPQIDFPTIQISASLPGADPSTMASTVAQPLETQLSRVPGVAQMTSSSSLGQTQITVQFELDRDINSAANDVQSAIDAAAGLLPKNLPSLPTYRKVNPADAPVLQLSATSDTLPLIELSDLMDVRVAQQISQLSGVAQVNIGGQQKPAIRIQIDPARLAAAGLTLEDIRSQIAVVSVSSPKGNIDDATRSFTILNNDQLTDAASWNDAIVAKKGAAAIRVRDVGKAVAGPEDAYRAHWTNGQLGVALDIFRQPGHNVVDTVDRVKAELPRLQASLPSSIKLAVVTDRTTTIRASLRDVQFTLGLTIALVVLVIFIFLRNLWATAIASVTVPLALLGACPIMWLCGFSIDNLSLMALTIAVGFVVDDAIVMLENVTRHIEDGDEPLDAALKGAKEVGFTIVAISVSLVAVLIPLLLMGGIIGRLFREFALTLAMSIAVSALVSLTLTPTLAARFMRARPNATHGSAYLLIERGLEALTNSYARALDIVLRHNRTTLAIFFAALFATIYLFIIIPKGFFPTQDTGFIAGISDAAPGISFEDMKKRQLALSEIVMQDPDVYSVFMDIGGGNGGQALNSGHVNITLKSRDQREASAQEVIARLGPQLAKVEGAQLFMQAAQDINVGGRPSRTQFQYTLQDANIDELNTLVPKIVARLAELRQLRDVASDQQIGGAALMLKIDRDAAALYGITPQLIDDTLYDAFGQRQVAQYSTQVNTYRVVMELSPGARDKVIDLERLFLRSDPSSPLVSLATVAKWNTGAVTPVSINHQGQFPSITISFNLASGVSLGQATAAIQVAERELKLPMSLKTSFQGTAKAFQDSLGTVPLLILGALVVVYLILGVLYESFIHPLTILSTLPSAGLGALVALMAAGFDFSLVALIGIILLIGIVKKNGIMLVDFAIVAEREEGLSSEAAIRKAALLRFRPIIMTTMAALLGSLPLMLGHGIGSELRQPLGYAMVGGLLVSQALTLFTTPVIYVYLDRFSSWVSGSSLGAVAAHGADSHVS